LLAEGVKAADQLVGYLASCPTAVYTNLPLGRVCLVFRCDLSGGCPAPQPCEARELAWLTPGEARARMCDAHYARIVDASQPDDRPALRGHDGVSLLTHWQPGNGSPMALMAGESA
jgi:hypothetical protein